MDEDEGNFISRAGPDAIDENTAKITIRVREDGEARASERQRLPEAQTLATREAERLRLEEERKEQSEGGRISMS